MRYPMPPCVALLLAAALMAVETRPLPAQGYLPDARAAGQPAPAPESTPPAPKRWLSLPKLPWSKKDKPQASTRHPGSDAPKSRSAADSKLEAQAAFARLNERRGQPELAVAIYRELLRKEPGMSLPNHRLGVMEATKGNFEAADAHFQTALRGDPGNPELLIDAGYCLYLQNRLDEAEELYYRAYQINPDDQALCNNLGLLLAEQKRIEEALTMFKRGSSIPAAHANVGFVMAQLGELELAERHFHAALDLDPTLRPAAVGLMQLDALKRSQVVEAALARASNQAAETAPDANPPAPLQEPPAAIALAPGQQAAIASQLAAPSAVDNATFQQSQDPSGSPAQSVQNAVANSGARSGHVAVTDFTTGTPAANASMVADVVSGGRMMVSDRGNPYPIRYGGTAVASDGPEAAPQTAHRSEHDRAVPSRGLATRPNTGSVLIGDIQAARSSETGRRSPAQPPDRDATARPVGRAAMPPAAGMLPVTAPSAIPPILGSHYNLSPHSQMWSSPPTIQAEPARGGSPYPATPYGGAPPRQQFPAAPYSVSPVRR